MRQALQTLSGPLIQDAPGMGLRGHPVFEVGLTQGHGYDPYPGSHGGGTRNIFQQGNFAEVLSGCQGRYMKVRMPAVRSKGYTQRNALLKNSQPNW